MTIKTLSPLISSPSVETGLSHYWANDFQVRSAKFRLSSANMQILDVPSN